MAFKPRSDSREYISTVTHCLTSIFKTLQRSIYGSTSRAPQDTTHSSPRSRKDGACCPRDGDCALGPGPIQLWEKQRASNSCEGESRCTRLSAPLPSRDLTLLPAISSKPRNRRFWWHSRRIRSGIGGGAVWDELFPSKLTCWRPNPQDPRMALNSDIRSLKR